MTPEQMAIAALFAALQAGTLAVIRYLRDDNTRLRDALDKSNKASADLIAIQAHMLRKAGIKPPTTPPGDD